MRTPSILGIAIAVIASSPLASQGLARALPADTQFVAHIDLQRCAALIGEDTVRSALLEEGGGKLQEVLNRAERQWNFDPFRDLTAVTVFGSEIDKGQDPSVIIWATDRIDNLLERMADRDVISTQRRGDVRLSRISAAALARELGIEEGMDSDDEGWMYVGRIGNRRALLFGENADDIMDEAKVLAGEARSLADASDSFVTGNVAQDSLVFLQVSGSLEGLIPSGPASQVADRARGLEMAIWESDGELEANAVVDLGSAEEAKNVASVVTGLKGLAALTAGEEKGVPQIALDVLESFECKAEGSQISLRAYLPAKALIDEAMKRSGAARRGRGR
ncbi:MAG: hypothetical protein ACYTG5_06480 [Planctomycetota bacterium]|jgi:hypothetical protein